ncbi:MAG: adenylate/guanylate cyclase domain-containing protein [Mycobacteriales bacterium]
MTALPSGEVTFLFTDVEGSTRVLRALGPDYAGVLETQRELIRAAVEQHHGVVVDCEGDAVFAAFGSAVDAVAATLRAQAALSGYAWPGDSAVAVRMGLHTGPAAPVNGRYVAVAVHQAARVSAVAHGGQVTASAAAASAARPLPASVSFVDLGRYRLKDFDVAEPIYQLSHPSLRREFPVLRARRQATDNLPLQRTSFVGRESALAELRELLVANRLVTVVGAGGAGKSRLAVELGLALKRDYAPDGPWLVELASVREPAHVVELVAACVGVTPEPGRPLLGVLGEQLRSRRILLLIDNCEHLLDAVAALVDSLLSTTADVAVVATSREPLSLPGETVWHLPPLTTPRADGDVRLQDAATVAAVRLFVDRVAQSRPGFSLTAENLPAVAQICRRLEGIPLALELAAARSAVVSPAEVAARLERSFDVLGSTRGGPEHHQTLRAAIGWSVDLLAEAERYFFEQLSVFRGGFTIDAAAAVCAASGSIDALAVTGALAAKSLLVTDELDAATRLRMLEPVRQFAAEALTERGATPAVQRRHLEWCARFVVAERGDNFDSADIAQDADNVRAALDFSITADPVMGLEIATTVFPFWLRGHIEEGRRYLGQLVAAAGGVELPVRNLALINLGALDARVGDRHTARGHFTEALQLAAAGGDVANEVMACYFLTPLEEDAATATALAERALAAARLTDNPRLHSRAALVRGDLALSTGDLASADTWLLAAAAAAERSAEARAIGFTAMSLAALAVARSELSTAAAELLRALRIAVDLDLDVDAVVCVYAAAGLAARCGEDRAAARLARAARLAGRRMGVVVAGLFTTEDPVVASLETGDEDDGVDVPLSAAVASAEHTLTTLSARE